MNLKSTTDCCVPQEKVQNCFYFYENIWSNMSLFKGFALVISAANIVILTPILFSVIWYERFGPDQVSNGLLAVYFDQYLVHTPNAGWNVLFQCFSCKKFEKGRKSKKMEAKFSKNNFFLSLHPNVCWRFYSQEKKISPGVDQPFCVHLHLRVAPKCW